ALITSLVSTTGGNGTTPTQLLKNPGFEKGAANPSPWIVTAGVVDNSASEPAHSGAWKARLCGYGTTHTDSIAQTVTIPSTITKATLTFYLHIDTADTTATAHDTLLVQVRNGTGTVLKTLETYSNRNHNGRGYSLRTYDLSAYKGQTIQIYLVGTEDGSLQTS